jgi:2-dehydro-3-deoxy-L-rhamnonate dehydrogenase (NAD+)
MRFHDQIAAITGGADGLGLAIATRLHHEGATIWLLDRDADRLAQVAAAFSERCHTHLVDIADEPSVVAAFSAIATTSGRLDICINSAGVVGPNGKPIQDVSSADWSRTIAINLTGSFLVTRAAIPIMQTRNYGRILLIASIAGKDGNPGMCAYSASKAGVIGLVKSVGKELATSGITVNGLAPAVVRTALVDSMDPAQVNYMTSKIPMNRLGTLDEVAATACFIVSPEASFQTAFTWDLSGGRAVY